MQSLLILGRQPELTLAELESLYGPGKVQPLSSKVALVDIDPCQISFSRLGGCLKLARLLATLDHANWPEIIKFLTESSPEQSLKMPQGKMTLGLSTYDFNLSPKEIIAGALKIKRAIQSTGRSVRMVPNKTTELNSAQVIHNKLTSQRAWELLIVRSGQKTYIAQTVMVQDIEAYAKRDQKRPFRDARVGMLPPKLAQIIINLAAGNLPISDSDTGCPPEDQPLAKLNKTVLDPFCGSGVILQEASLMGYEVIGSDIDERMADYAQKNLEWLSKGYFKGDLKPKIIVGDARQTKWPKFDFMACETTLGKPLTSLPEPTELSKMSSALNDLIKQSLINIAHQTPIGLRLCLALPAWQISADQFKFLPIIDQLTDIGYNVIDFQHINAKRLVYNRPNQIVGRQLLIITRN